MVQAIKPNDIKDTVWYTMNDEKIMSEIDFSAFEEAFKLNPVLPKKERIDFLFGFPSIHSLVKELAIKLKIYISNLKHMVILSSVFEGEVKGGLYKTL